MTNTKNPREQEALKALNEALREAGHAEVSGRPQAETKIEAVNNVPVRDAGRMRDRQQRVEQQRTAAPAIPQKTTAQKRQEAEQLYTAYVQSDEYRQNLNAAAKAQTDAWMMEAITGKAEPMTPAGDQKEQQLKALVEHYKALEKQEKNQAVMDEALLELESWSPEERQMLEAYSTQLDWEALHPVTVAGANPMTNGSYQVAGTVAKDLIDKYGEAKVNRLAEALKWQKSAEATEAAAQKGREGADSGLPGAVGHNIASVGANILGGLTGVMAYIQELGRRTGQFETLDPNSAGNLPGVYAGAVRQKTAENISGDVYDETGEKVSDGGWIRRNLARGYQGLMSAADSGARLVAGGGAGGAALLAATGSFSQAVSEASRRGATPMEATALGTVTAGIEYLSEKIPLENLADAVKTGGHGAKEIVKNALLQAGVEATTEEVSLIATTLADAAILKEKGSYQQRMNELIASGMTVEAAQKTAFGELLEEAKETAIVSAFSGGLSEAGASLAGNLSHRDAAPELTEQQKTDRAMEETAAQWGQEMPQTAKPEKTEAELQLDQAYDATTGIEQKPTEQLTPQERGARYKASKVNTAILDLVDRVKKGLTKGSEKVQLGTVSDSNASQIQRETGIDTRGYSVAIEARQIEHILKDHGENGLANQSMANPEDIARIEYALNNPDRITRSEPTRAYVTNRDGKMKPADTVLYETRLEDGSYYVVQAVPETKKRTLYVLSAFIGKSDYKNEAPQSTNTVDPSATPKAESTVTPEGATQSTNINSPGATSETDSAGASIDSVPQNVQEVNGNIDESGAQRADNPEVYTEGGQVPKEKSVYETVMENGNVQPDRADDVRKMAMPETDINGDDVSAVAGNVYASKITPDDFAELMKEPAAKGKLSYAKITNDQAVEWAKETILMAGDWKTAYSDWKDSVAKGGAGAEMSARGALLLNHAAREGDKDLWQNILLDVQSLGTNTAQGLQAFKILRSLDPESKLKMTDKVIRRMVKEMRLGAEITVDEALLEKFRKAETDEDRDAIMTEIQQNVADQIPSTFLDKFTALRYTNMLGNLKTNVRNVAGNLAMKGTYKIKDSIAAGVETLLHKASGGKFQKTKSLTVSSELREACKADFAQYAGIVSDGGKYGDGQTAAGDFAKGVMEKRRIFKGDVRTGNEKFDKATNKVLGVAMAPAEGYRKATNWMMNNKYFGDEAFGRGAYARAMAGYLKANGVKDADLSKVDDALLDKARAYAIREAQEATFHDNTTLARIVQRGQKAAGIMGEGIMPFTKTPANILVRAEEFSPLGLINSTVKSLQSAAGNTKLAEKNGRLGQWAKAGREITGADIVNSWAKTFTGTVLFTLGAIMKDQGILGVKLSASGDDDEEKAAFDKMNGEQEYAIVLPDGTSYTMDWLGPCVMPMFMGAELAQAIEEAGGLDELTWADWENILTSVSDPMLQMSMLSGLNDSLDNIKYSDNSLMQFCINAAVSYLTQGLGNTLLGQMEKSTEKVRTQTYIDKDSQVPVWMQKQLGSVSQKIPLWDYQQTPYIDARGQEQAQPTGFGGWLYNLLSPGYLSKKDVDSISEELYRLHETGATENNVFLDSPSTTFSYTDKDGVKHEDYNLSAKEAEALKRSVGKTSVKVLQALLETDTYKAMTDQQKTDALKYVDDYAREKGRTEAVEGYEGMSKWMQGIEGKEADAIVNKAVTSAFLDAFSLMDRDMDEAGEALDQAYELIVKNPAKGNSIMEDAGGKTEKFIQAARMGIDGRTFVELYSKYDAIDKDKSLDTTQKAQKWAHTLQTAREDGTIKDAFTMNKLKDIMEFRYSMPAETDKYDLMVEQGVNSDNADFIVGLLDGITGTGSVDKDTGKARVTDADERMAIATSKLADKELDTAMKAYMPDYDPNAKKPNYTEVKYDYIRQELGYTAEQYAKAYRITSGDGKKDQQITDLKKDIGITDAQARELYGILDGNKNAMLKDWAEELYG